MAKNALGPTGAKIIAEALSRNWNLELLDMSDNMICVDKAAFEKVSSSHCSSCRDIVVGI
jgi:hypothetical protein